MYKNPSWKIFVYVAALAVLLGGLIYWADRNSTAPGKFDELASCLRDKGVTMYGAAWCPHCQNQKNEFGNSFRLVPYVECPDNPTVCIEKKVESYPTWIFPGDKRLVGEQSLEKLAEGAGCPVPVAQ